MTRVLAIDTSTSWGGAALLEIDSGQVLLIAEAGLEVEDGLAARMLPIVDLLLAAASWPKSSLDLYAAGRGPGSFTGIRVGLGLLQGLALASGRPCVGVGTLDAVAESHGPAEADRVPILPAGRGNLYRARFDAGSSPPRPLGSPEAWPGERVLDGLGHAVAIASRGLVLPGAPEGIRLGVAPTSIAAGVGRIAALRFLSGLTDADAPSPLYVRPTYAEAASR